jgi:hypothetical protein
MSKDEKIIFRPWIQLPNGKRIYASHYGLRAFPIKVRDEKRRKRPPRS